MEAARRGSNCLRAGSVFIREPCSGDVLRLSRPGARQTPQFTNLLRFAQLDALTGNRQDLRLPAP